MTVKVDMAEAWALLLRCREGKGEEAVDPTPEARELLELFFPILRRSEIAVGQLGQSVDGRIATEEGHSHYVTGKEDILRLHRLRALVDAVVVGAGTVFNDDPQLTVREVEGPDPVRVVLDPRGRLEPRFRIFHGNGGRTLLVRREGGEEEEEVAPEVEVVRLPVREPLGFHPMELLKLLRGRGLRRILVEGGGVTVSRFLEAGALDRLHLTVSPLIIGSGRPGIQLPPIATLDQGIRPRVRHFILGDDVLFDLELEGRLTGKAER